VKASSRKGLLELVNAERAAQNLPPMTEAELSAAVDQVKRIEHRQHWYRFRHALGEEHATLPGRDAVTTPLHVLEVQRAMAFRDAEQLDERIQAHRTGKPLPWQAQRRISAETRPSRPRPRTWKAR
jgi:hypothetical protein